MLEISKKRRKSSVVSLASLFMEGGWGLGFKYFTLWKAVFISGLICTVFGSLDQENIFREKSFIYVGEITNERTNPAELWFGKGGANYLSTISPNFCGEWKEIAKMAVEAVNMGFWENGSSRGGLGLLGKKTGAQRMFWGNRRSSEGDYNSKWNLWSEYEGGISAGLQMSGSWKLILDTGQVPLWNGGVEIRTEKSGGSYLGCWKNESDWTGRDLPGIEVVGHCIDWNGEAGRFWTGVVEREAERRQIQEKIEKVSFVLRNGYKFFLKNSWECNGFFGCLDFWVGGV